MLLFCLKYIYSEQLKIQFGEKSLQQVRWRNGLSATMLLDKYPAEALHLVGSRSYAACIIHKLC